MEPENIRQQASPIYLLETFNDRDRLYLQRDLYGPAFDFFLEKALKNGQLVANPAKAKWRLLDAGCGEGLLTAKIIDQFPGTSLCGFDLDSEAIMTANMIFGSRGDLNFFVHDLLVPLPTEIAAGISGRGFDLVLAWLVIGHLKNAQLALTNLYRALKPGGTILLFDPGAQWLQFLHPSVQALIKLVDAGWQRVGSFEFGSRHKEELTKAGFREITTEKFEFTVGGSTESGQQHLNNLLSLFINMRLTLVENLKLMAADEFNYHIEQTKLCLKTELEGVCTFYGSIGLK